MAMDPAPVRRRGFRAGMPPFWAGVIASVVILVVVFFAFTGANPFSHPFQLKADFLTARPHLDPAARAWLREAMDIAQPGHPVLPLM